ncbi:DUF45 domain-containing protein [Aristophania vespae]|uniref:DUF45 domain-containing protein n=1 Tax=Aristophania vespae TaxID=2697033 RepID=A0A6P1NC38_9PROT|nr:SprT family zinc-dependent metalloprotease [Aristophania vespae]QHI95098.1 DUF45 domain-containing protein [Aristophania vespae]UMM64297.1 hypothetical protein DM15PD_13090 [Aristophania vespae]
MLSPPLIWRKNSRARRLSLRVDPAKRAVIITLPPRISKKEGLAFLHSQSLWVRRAFEELPLKALDARSILIEGINIPLFTEPNAKRGVWLDESGIHISGNAEHHERRLKDFLRRLAIERITPFVKIYSQNMALFPSTLALRDVRSRWGSCTRQGRLMLNWRLLLAPANIRDYVIIHELAHLKYFNHGSEFWSLVDQYCPQGKEGRVSAENWLKVHGPVLLSII